MRGLGPIHFKQQELPLARIKKIMKVGSFLSRRAGTINFYFVRRAGTSVQVNRKITCIEVPVLLKNGIKTQDPEFFLSSVDFVAS